MPDHSEIFELINNIHTTEGKKTIIEMFSAYLDQAPSLTTKEQFQSLNFLLEFLDVATMNSLNLNFMQEVTGKTATKIRDISNLPLKSRYLRLLARLPLHDQRLKEFVAGILLQELEQNIKETWYLEEVLRTLYWLLEHLTDPHKKEFRNKLFLLLESKLLPSTELLLALILVQVKDMLLAEEHERLVTIVVRYKDENTKRSRNALFTYITLLKSDTFPLHDLEHHVENAITWVTKLGDQGFIGYLFNIINSFSDEKFILVSEPVKTALSNNILASSLGQGLKQELTMKLNFS